MGFYAKGDSRKVICSSDDEEGYDNIRLLSSRTVNYLSQVNVRSRRDFLTSIFGEVPPVATVPVSDDADRPFWAEDESSSSESRQRISAKQKRRHSLSYRNRIAIHRSRSVLFHSSSSSSDSARLKILSEASKRVSPRQFLGSAQRKQSISRGKTDTIVGPSTSFKSTSSSVNKQISFEHPAPASQVTKGNTYSTSSSSNHRVEKM